MTDDDKFYIIQEIVQLLGSLTPVELDKVKGWEAEGFSTLWILERLLKDRGNK